MTYTRIIIICEESKQNMDAHEMEVTAHIGHKFYGTCWALAASRKNIYFIFRIVSVDILLSERASRNKKCFYSFYIDIFNVCILEHDKDFSSAW